MFLSPLLCLSSLFCLFKATPRFYVNDSLHRHFHVYSAFAFKKNKKYKFACTLKIAVAQGVLAEVITQGHPGSSLIGFWRLRDRVVVTLQIVLSAARINFWMMTEHHARFTFYIPNNNLTDSTKCPPQKISFQVVIKSVTERWSVTVASINPCAYLKMFLILYFFPAEIWT